uniref:PX domain-containing protein n=1 Tax=Pseudictyota dubia TaxID=2749911 RepID=A0A7R9W131_9STRA|mmetsp:Transcript_28021/g.52173  ORF Transcript_28021/g.52173 Transcript_28021/m.52173 type:complete len:118 (+) Transcript_28021:207-560(+)
MRATKKRVSASRRVNMIEGKHGTLPPHRSDIIKFWAHCLVKVTDPQVHGEGPPHLVFHSSTPDTEPAEVNRRYSDFQRLHRRLLTERPGAIVGLSALGLNEMKWHSWTSSSTRFRIW